MFRFLIIVTSAAAATTGGVLLREMIIVLRERSKERLQVAQIQRSLAAVEYFRAAQIQIWNMCTGRGDATPRPRFPFGEMPIVLDDEARADFEADCRIRRHNHGQFSSRPASTRVYRIAPAWNAFPRRKK